jgi:hypothetical protein
LSLTGPRFGTTPRFGAPVRRGGGSAPPPPAFTPDSVTSAGLVLWLKADAGTFQDAAGTTPAGAGGDPVALWRDQSGAGNHATQPSPTLRPTLATAALNGLPALAFDGSLQTIVVPSLDSRTMFVALNHTDGAAFTNYRRILDADDSANWSILGESGTTKYTPNALTRGISAANFRVNGAVTNEASPLASYRLISATADATATSAVQIGSYAGIQLLQGNVAEILIYDGPLSADDREGVEGYFNDRYDLW